MYIKEYTNSVFFTTLVMIQLSMETTEITFFYIETDRFKYVYPKHC